VLSLRERRKWLVGFALVVLICLASCGQIGEFSLKTPRAAPSAILTSTPEPAEEVTDTIPGLTADEAATLSSLRKVDDHPLYTMHYYGNHGSPVAQHDRRQMGDPSDNWAQTLTETWACSLFAAFGDSAGMVYGRNFDWRYSPALLLYTDPPDSYASVSMVDIEYLGFGASLSGAVDKLPLDERERLLDAPSIPFDGMNETGLVVAMAAVSAGDMQPDPNKESIGSLGVIREILDHASSTQEAVEIMASYNINMGEGPPLHYLIADATGEGVLVEFYQGEMKVIPNESPYHRATNFIRSGQGDSADGVCWRYDEIGQRLEESRGQLSNTEAMDLLQNVSQANTQWSIVYGMMDMDVLVAMDRDYDKLHAFDFQGNDK